MGPSLSCDRMGKAKKQLTNERRAKRLGTGEGIAPTKAKGGGGMPGWAFMVSGAVLLAAVIIAAAFVAMVVLLGGHAYVRGRNARLAASALMLALTLAAILAGAWLTQS